MCLASDAQFSDFLDGMGPAQFVGRQTLATTSMGERGQGAELRPIVPSVYIQMRWTSSVLYSAELLLSGSVSSLAVRQRPWPNNSDTDWTDSTPNLLPSPTLYNVRELRITRPANLFVCRFQKECIRHRFV